MYFASFGERIPQCCLLLQTSDRKMICSSPPAPGAIDLILHFHSPGQGFSTRYGREECAEIGGGKEFRASA